MLEITQAGYPHNDSIAILQHVIPVHGFADSPV
jgi:hypothetical protein